MILSVRVRSLASLLKNMSACYIKILNSNKAAIRELYYDDKQLFKTQAYSNRSLEMLSSVLQVQRSELNLVATAKVSNGEKITLLLHRS
jgi:DNA topoisomerase VI subunit A